MLMYQHKFTIMIWHVDVSTQVYYYINNTTNQSNKK